VTEQLEFKFFWPLTEQIPLELDYTDCAKPQLGYPLPSGGIGQGPITVSFGPFATGHTTITAAHLSLDIDTTTLKVREKPGLCRRTILKCLGLKWEIK
jgi:hypothetical protein